MPARDVRTVLDGMSYLECPRWHDGRLYVSDFYTQRVYRVDLDGGGAAEPVAEVPEQPSGLGWMPDGSMLVVSMRDRRGLRLRDGRVTTPDGGTLVVAETLAGGLTAFDVDADGGLSNRRVWAQLSETVDTEDMGELLAAGGIAPDGIALDADGCIWAADALGGRVLHVREGGEVLEEIAPGVGVFACGLGGADGRTLVMCAAPSFAEHERRDTREARLLVCEVDVPGAGLP